MPSHPQAGRWRGSRRAPRPLRAGPGQAGTEAAAAHPHRPSFGVGNPQCVRNKNNTGETQCKTRVCSRRRSPRGGGRDAGRLYRRGDVSGEAGEQGLGRLMLLLPLPSTPEKNNPNTMQRLCSFPTAMAIPTRNFISPFPVPPSAAGLALLQAAPHRGPDGRRLARRVLCRRLPSTARPAAPAAAPALPTGSIAPSPASWGLPGHRLPPSRGSGPAASLTPPLSGSVPLPQRGDTLSPAAKRPCGPCGWVLSDTAKTVTFSHLFAVFLPLSIPPGIYRGRRKP